MDAPQRPDRLGPLHSNEIMSQTPPLAFVTPG